MGSGFIIVVSSVSLFLWQMIKKILLAVSFVFTCSQWRRPGPGASGDPGSWCSVQEGRSDQGSKAPSRQQE